eukprot:Cvel_34178.t1-p1 / transcript=Cvel_34178.t1 / gene=Cvel_34178 / organism=Chromera_velia_CCMP2878 / gene_product=hypothetical protein / transcript_product=hypothetical protein / location=Cvel_scaffold5777:1-3018(-) / protein_length=673 / sequence_SO=supercontig / SO=protein_coding / is_pseudo=false
MPPLPPPKSSKGRKGVGGRPTRAEAEGLKDRYVPLGEYRTNLVSTMCGSSPALERPRHIAGLEAIKAYRNREMPPFTAVRTEQQQQERDAHQQEQHKRKRRMNALSSAAPLPPIPEEDPDAANGSYENGRRNRANTIEKLDSCRDAPSFHGAPFLDPRDYERSGKGAEKLADKTTAVVGLVDDLYGLKALPAEERAEGLTSAFASIACKASSIKEMELAEKIAENTQQGGYRFVDTERENRADMPLHIKKRLERVRGLNKICKIKSKQAKNLNFWLHKKWKRTPADWLEWPHPDKVGEAEKVSGVRGYYIRLLMEDEWGGEYFSTNADLSEEGVIGQEWVVSIDGSSGSGLADGGGYVSLMMRPLCVPNEALYRVDLSCCLGIANWQENVNTITSLFEAPEIKTGGTLLSTTGIVLQKGPHAGKTVKIEFHGTADQSAELKGKGHVGASCATSCSNCFQNDKEMQTLKGLEKWVPKDANFNPRRPTRQGGGSSASEAELNAEEGDEIPPPCEEEEEAKRKEGEETKKAKIQPLCRHECNCPLEPNEEGKQCGRKVLYEMNFLWRDSILINTDTLIPVANPELSKKPTAPKFVWPKKSLQGRTVVKLSLQHKDMFRMCHMTDTKERIMHKGPNGKVGGKRPGHGPLASDWPSLADPVGFQYRRQKDRGADRFPP